MVTAGIKMTDNIASLTHNYLRQKRSISNDQFCDKFVDSKTLFTKCKSPLNNPVSYIYREDIFDKNALPFLTWSICPFTIEEAVIHSFSILAKFNLDACFFNE